MGRGCYGEQGSLRVRPNQVNRCMNPKIYETEHMPSLADPTARP